ncbi:MAG: di-heme oxidoredictase family protein [Polyangiales bacterium]
MSFLHSLRRWGPAGLALAAACSDPAPEPTIATGIFAAMGDVRPNATPEQRETFARGLAVARRRFTPEMGLGPTYNVSSCTDCHERPVAGGGGARYRNFLLTGQTLPDQSFTPTGVNGVLDQYSLATGRTPTPARTNLAATRNPIPFFGVGLLAEVSDAEILSRADPDDRDHDGVSGRPNYDRGYVGRFGRKAQTVSIEGFIRGPIFNHLGVTTNPLPDALKARLPVPSAADLAHTRQAIAGLAGERQTSQAQVAAPDEPTTDDDGVPDPEMSEQDLFDLVSYAMLTAAPSPDAPTAQTAAGRATFDRVGCAACHAPALRGPRGLIPAYSDLLLHDMGAALADGVPMKLATGSEFRTQPLWGVAATGPYLHDGRADTLDEAITLHGGEAQGARDRYVALSEAERAGVLAFLASLGGGAQATEGLLAPDAPAPSPGAWGGPLSALTGEAAARFERGRRLFDRDFGYGQGLGPSFNGDSCRACHFDPVLGGAGPRGVDVTRQGIFDALTETFSAPAMGTMAHRFGALDARPAVDAMANVFELRQTPPTLGLGLIESIPASAIVARADPDDADGDGVRGRARYLPDGRLGRFGWKANVPTVREFVRDAMTNEMGVTVPAVAGESFGALADDDRARDPELSATQLDELSAFVAALAPPPRTHGDVTLESQGEALFARVGCAACHAPSLPGGDGQPVPLYSDLLLHDVAAPGALGVVDGPAGAREFRTPPLWGIARTAPYMHDGRADTVEAAIAAHDGEAGASVRAVTALDARDREALVAFLRSL